MNLEELAEKIRNDGYSEVNAEAQKKENQGLINDTITEMDSEV